MAKSFFLCLLAAAALFSSVSAITDVDILNFALNLEYLEATFYSYAAYGRGLSAADRGGGPAAIGGPLGSFSAITKQYATDLARDELAHVRFLRAALGKAAVPAPLINVGTAFQEAIVIVNNGSTGFPDVTPYANDMLFFLGAYLFEDLGVTAYKGAAPLLNSSAILEAAAGILAVEAYHAGAIRERLYAIKDETIAPYGVTIKSLAASISSVRQAASGVPDSGIEDCAGDLVILPGDTDAIAYSRSPQQVLRIVYHGGITRGGFFPRGMNGNIK